MSTALAKRLGLITLLALVSVGCLAGTEGRPRSPLPVPVLPASRSVFLAPIGDFPIGDAEALVAHYHEKFGMTIAILPPIAVPGEAFDADRKQVIAERIIDAIGAGHPVAGDPAAVVIGLTSADLYIASEPWAWAYGLRTQGHLAVVSTAHMNDFLGTQRMRRLQKLVTKNIGLLYFGLPLSDDPGSVLYRDVGGQGDLDRMSEDF